MKAVLRPTRSEQGSVLLIVVVLLSLFGLTAIALTNSTTTELRVAKNQEIAVRSFYAAEAGYHAAAGKYYADPGSFQAKATPAALGLATTRPAAANLGNALAYWIAGMSYDPANPPQYVDIESCGTVLGTNSVARVKARLNRFVPVAEAFRRGILIDGDLTLDGSPNIMGSIHANGDVRLNGGGTIDGNVSAGGSVHVQATVTGTVQGGAEQAAVPEITPADFAGFSSTADIRLSETATGQGAGTITEPAVFDGSGDQHGRLIYCQGNLVVSGCNLFNATIVATGGVTLDGTIQSDGGTINVAVIAGGDITINGSNSIYGVFWTNGGLVQNGSGHVTGAIVCRGDISRSGSFNFAYNGDIENRHLPSGAAEFKRVIWKQQF